MLGFQKNQNQKPRILVVDDDPMFDGLVVDHLTEDNEYAVLSARSGDQALKILDQTNVDVLITDIKMPNTDGFELVNHVRTEFPNLSVIVISGFGRPRWLDRGDDEGGIQFIEKPINFSRLKKIVRKAVYDAVPVPHSPQSPQEEMDDKMLSGNAAQYPVLDMIQICCIAERTGCVTLRRGEESSRIYLDQGEIVHAEAGSLTGSDAFYELAGWDDADFVFENSVSASEKTIFQAWESLVYEGIQCRAARVAK